MNVSNRTYSLNQRKVSVFPVIKQPIIHANIHKTFLSNADIHAYTLRRNSVWNKMKWKMKEKKNKTFRMLIVRVAFVLLMSLIKSEFFIRLQCSSVAVVFGIAIAHAYTCIDTNSIHDFYRALLIVSIQIFTSFKLEKWT